MPVFRSFCDILWLDVHFSVGRLTENRGKSISTNAHFVPKTQRILGLFQNVNQNA